MSVVAPLIKLQGKAHDLMTRSMINHKKAGWKTYGSLQSRLTQLEDKCLEMQHRHQEILSKKIAADETLEYLEDDLMVNYEDTFIEERGKYLEEIYSLQATVVSPANDNNRQALRGNVRRKLPPIDPPKFSGKYSEWLSFKDKFTALIADDPDLEGVDRLHYLSSCLSGEASSCIKNVPITNENYDRAWSRLKKHYDNKRVLISSALDALFTLPSLTTESAQGLRQIRDGVTEAVESLESLERPVKHWDDLLVYMIVRHLDSRTLRDRETSLADSTDPIAYKTLETFFNSRIKALERVEESKSISSVNTTSAKKQNTNFNSSKQVKPQSKVYSHAVTNAPTSSSYSSCNQTHYIAHCEAFRNLDVAKRSSFISNNNLCFNCLGPHAIKNCRSPKVATSVREGITHYCTGTCRPMMQIR